MSSKIHCVKCNGFAGYFFSCKSVYSSSDGNFEPVEENGYMCLECIQGKEVRFSWDDW